LLFVGYSLAIDSLINDYRVNITLSDRNVKAFI
jgi:hypothetical protein